MMMSRIDFQEELTLLPQKKMQFMWELPHNRLLFTMVLFYRYVAPEDYQYDYRWQRYDFNKFYRGESYNKPSLQKSFGLNYWLRYIYKKNKYNYNYN